MDSCARRWLPMMVATILGLSQFANTAFAAGLSAGQRKELTAIRNLVYKVHVPVRRDSIDDAEKKIAEAQKRLDALITETQLPADDPHFASLIKLIASRKEAIAKAREKAQPVAKKGDRASRKGEGVSFVGQIAPIVKAHCLECHGNDAKGGLRLDTFSGFEKGGKSGELLVVGDPDSSLLMTRLLAANDTRMPKGGEPLSEKECSTIAEWIKRGAKFDGDDRAKTLDKLVAAAPSETAAPGGAAKPKMTTPRASIPKPMGGESVAFTRDIAPILVNSCLRCHSGNDPKGGLSMETFEALWAGGKSGAVIEPGDLDKSRLWQLAGEQKPFKMPPGDEQITKSEWSRLRTWISEGAAFDGDPKQKLASLVPSEVERRKAELAQTSSDELRQKRRSRSEEQWRRTFPKTEPAQVENDDFVVLGNVSAERLNEAARLAGEALRAAQEFLGDSSRPAFKGGLALFVLKDRNSFEEFSQTVQKREPPSAIHGSAVVTPGLKDAYVVVEDRESASAQKGGERQPEPSLKNSLVEQLTEALLKRADKKLPDWLVAGSGRVAAAGGSQAALESAQWPALYRLVGSLEKSDDLLNNGTFSAAAIGDVGEAVTASLIEKRGKAMYVRFVQQLVNGGTQADAFRGVYGIEPQAFAEEFVTRAARAANGEDK
ncbi:MAG TPA: c-type cytochrome domain-containing protein [Planctomycetaceae bacterium]|nr:c-type cytochrome domain-containing protein [Planctomycetaceae bacterium]